MAHTNKRLAYLECIASCVKTIETALKNINGVVHAEINFADKTAIVEVD